MKQKSKAASSKIKAEIRKICKGLFYISETDAPVDLFDLEDLPKQERKELQEKFEAAERSDDRQVTIDDFFQRPAAEKEWHTPSQKTAAKKYRKLWKIFSDELSEPNVYRVGAIRIDIYVVGKTEDGSMIGIRTRAVET